MDPRRECDSDPPACNVAELARQSLTLAKRADNRTLDTYQELGKLIASLDALANRVSEFQRDTHEELAKINRALKGRVSHHDLNKLEEDWETSSEVIRLKDKNLATRTELESAQKALVKSQMDYRKFMYWTLSVIASLILAFATALIHAAVTR